jgi:hypothetical protein
MKMNLKLEALYIARDINSCQSESNKKLLVGVIEDAKALYSWLAGTERKAKK